MAARNKVHKDRNEISLNGKEPRSDPTEGYGFNRR